MKPKINIYFIFILLAAGLWGTAGIFVRTVEKIGISEMQVVFARSFFSSATLLFLILINDRSLLRIKVKDVWIFISSGIFSIVLFNFCYYRTMALTSLSVAAVLLYTAPIFVVLISIFIFGQKLTVHKIVSCITAFLGCCFVSGIFNSAQRIGAGAMMFGILTGFGYALYTIFGGMLLKRGYNSLTINFYFFLFAAVGCLPFINLAQTVNTIVSSHNGLLLTFLMAIFNTVIPYILYIIALKGVEASIAPIIATLEPVVATLIGVLIYHEAMTVSGIVGIILVLLSVLILNLRIGVSDDGNNKIAGKCKNQSDSWNNRKAYRRLP